MTSNVPPQLRSWLDYSETITGLILSGKLTHIAFSPEMFMGEYSKIIKDIKSGMSKDDLYDKYTNTIQIAQHAGKSVNGLAGELDWAGLLSKKYTRELMIGELPKLEKLLEAGEDEKAGELLRRLSSSHSSSQKLRSVRASQISNNYEPFIKSGSRVWDSHIGGYPAVGIVILGAKTFTGKTTVAINAIDLYLQEYPDREAMFVTLEDMNEGWKFRANQILGERSEKFWERIHVMEFAGNVGEIIEEASRHEKVSAIFLDYIDYLAKDKDLNSYDHIYQTMGMGAKSLAVNNLSRNMTVFMLAQFGKGAYKGGVPGLNALLYTGEQYAYQICFLYHAEGDHYSDDEENGYYLPAVKGKGYLVFWKVKGARPHEDDGFPGAIQVPWTGRYGYDLSSEKSEWFSLASETKQKKKKK